MRDYEWDLLYYEALREVDEMCPGSTPVAPRRATETEMRQAQQARNVANDAAYLALQAAEAQQAASIGGISAQHGQVGLQSGLLGYLRN